ncbi:ABC transporter permease, partial [Vibrio parahaemolyticus]|nr:ABC transporter permease [Vibrio parahaemolyticus]
QGALSLARYNIKQFNSYRYRTSINYIPFNLHIFEGSLETNFILHNGLIPTEKMREMVSFFELDTWLPQGLDTQLSVDICKSLPNGIQQRLRLALGLGNCEQSLIIIDEPFNGAEQENSHYFKRLFSDKLLNKTVIFSTNDPGMISTSNMSLVLEPDGNLKYFGLTDKYLKSLS